jgi:hypothetical protein
VADATSGSGLAMGAAQHDAQAGSSAQPSTSVAIQSSWMPNERRRSKSKTRQRRRKKKINSKPRRGSD